MKNTITYGDGTGNSELLGLEDVVDKGTTVMYFPKHYFFKNGKPKKKYFHRTTYPVLRNKK